MHIITGGAGFIGSNIAATLDELGQDIVIVDWLGEGDKWKNIAKRRVRDIVRPERLFEFLAGNANRVESVIHMGAISTTTEGDADAILENNFRLSVDLWNWCAEHRVPFVYASSAATYGDGEAGFVDSEDPAYLASLQPLNAYGWSKHVFDRWALENRARGLASPPRWAGLKFFNVYGPNEYHKGGQRSVAHQLFVQIEEAGKVKLFQSDHPDYGHGEQTRDFVWVQDCVDVALWALNGEDVPSGIYNVGSGLPRSFADKARAMFATMKRDEAIEFIPLPEKLKGKYQYYTKAELDKLRDAGFEGQSTPLEVGIQRYVEHFLATDDPYR